jgi:hypothetical protein
MTDMSADKHGKNLIGKSATLTVNLTTDPRRREERRLTIQVKILDERSGYFGRHEHLVTPVAGAGQAWVEKISINE